MSVTITNLTWQPGSNPESQSIAELVRSGNEVWPGWNFTQTSPTEFSVTAPAIDHMEEFIREFYVGFDIPDYDALATALMARVTVNP
jgi:hypothetical protein